MASPYTRRRMEWAALFGGIVGAAIGIVGYLTYDLTYFFVFCPIAAVMAASTVWMMDGGKYDYRAVWHIAISLK